MKTYKLTDFLGLKGAKARKFEHQILQLESKSGHQKSISAKIMAEIYAKSNKILIELGFSKGDILVDEAISALKNKLLGDEISPDEEFWKENRATIILAEDGIVSANKNDVRKKVDFDENSLENFREEFKAEILKKYSDEFRNYSIENIEEKLF